MPLVIARSHAAMSKEHDSPWDGAHGWLKRRKVAVAIAIASDLPLTASTARLLKRASLTIAS